MTILIVDDEQRIRSVFCKTMRKEGFHVLEAGNAKDAYDLLLQNQVDLILLDINMIDVNGRVFFEVARTFCAASRVIVASVYPLEEQKKLIADAADYYDKSDSLQVLIRKVRRVMKTFQEEPKQ